MDGGLGVGLLEEAFRSPAEDHGMLALGCTGEDVFLHILPNLLVMERLSMSGIVCIVRRWAGNIPCHFSCAVQFKKENVGPAYTVEWDHSLAELTHASRSLGSGKHVASETPCVLF